MPAPDPAGVVEGLAYLRVPGGRGGAAMSAPAARDLAHELAKLALDSLVSLLCLVLLFALLR